MKDKIYGESLQLKCKVEHEKLMCSLRSSYLRSKINHRAEFNFWSSFLRSFPQVLYPCFFFFILVSLALIWKSLKDTYKLWYQNCLGVCLSIPPHRDLLAKNKTKIACTATALILLRMWICARYESLKKLRIISNTILF